MVVGFEGHPIGEHGGERRQRESSERTGSVRGDVQVWTLSCSLEAMTRGGGSHRSFMVFTSFSGRISLAWVGICRCDIWSASDRLDAESGGHVVARGRIGSLWRPRQHSGACPKRGGRGLRRSLCEKTGISVAMQLHFSGDIGVLVVAVALSQRGNQAWRDFLSATIR